MTLTVFRRGIAYLEGGSLVDPGMPMVLKATKAVSGSFLRSDSQSFRGSRLAKKPCSGMGRELLSSMALGVTDASGKPEVAVSMDLKEGGRVATTN